MTETLPPWDPNLYLQLPGHEHLLRTVTEQVSFTAHARRALGPDPQSVANSQPFFEDVYRKWRSEQTKRRFMRKAVGAMLDAATQALKSKDRSTQVGCVLYAPQSWSQLSAGYNGFPRGVDDDIDDRHERPQKYQYAVHAERNAIDNAARNGTTLEGATAVVTMMPCAQCCGSLINAGCTRIISLAPPPGFEARWGESMEIARVMQREAGIPVTYLTREDFDTVGVSPYQRPLLDFLFPA